MNYEISTIENCYKTMAEMTGFQYWEDIFKIYAYQYIDEPELMKNEIMDSKNIHIKNVELEEINFVLMHVTTSANGCKYIKEEGLHDLVWSYTHNTELRQFLDEQHITIDIENQEINVNGTKYVMSDNINQSGGVGYKFLVDPYICGCFQIEKSSPYGGGVHQRPEILYNINKLVKGVDLEYMWYKTHQPYIVKFKVPYNKMNIILSETTDSKKDRILRELFNKAFYTVFYNDFDSNKMGILKKGEYVPANDIISIEEY
ncbi:hypothetical protein [[Clostridium] scindens]|uniref:hypothetical protein n=1 Tax=Clostridium scindens (strain JCM 10418 / VPI 12708) TaxID=29347 RepID=UPI00248D8AAC|nr:hypothetical protein [[Clostridium] scindens]